MALMPSVTHRGSGTDAKAVLGMIGDADGVGRVLDGVGSTLFVGRVEVTDEFVGYRRKRYDRVVQTCGLELPPVQFATVGVWCVVSRRIRDAVRAAGWAACTPPSTLVRLRPPVWRRQPVHGQAGRAADPRPPDPLTPHDMRPLGRRSERTLVPPADKILSISGCSRALKQRSSPRSAAAGYAWALVAGASAPSDSRARRTAQVPSGVSRAVIPGVSPRTQHGTPIASSAVAGAGSWSAGRLAPVMVTAPWAASSARVPRTVSPTRAAKNASPAGGSAAPVCCCSLVRVARRSLRSTAAWRSYSMARARGGRPSAQSLNESRGGCGSAGGAAACRAVRSNSSSHKLSATWSPAGP